MGAVKSAKPVKSVKSVKPTKATTAADCEQLEQLPNIGVSLAADLRLLGITHPRELAQRDALELYHALCRATGQRQDRVCWILSWPSLTSCAARRRHRGGPTRRSARRCMA